MRIAVIGSGGVGGTFGAALAKAGADVTFVARGAHLAAIRERGLRVEGGRPEIVVRPAQATEDPASIGPVDLVLFCVKLWDVESAGEAIRPIVGADTAVVPLQNGIDASARLTPILGANAVMGGVAQVTRLPVGKLRDDPDLLALYRTVMREVLAVGRASGVDLPDELIEKRMADVGAFPAAGRASMAVDLERGNRIELPWLAGKVVALGREHDVPTPANATIYAALKPYVNGKPG